jgi:RNA polymerase sigma-70 factor, ECF subfamily
LQRLCGMAGQPPDTEWLIEQARRGQATACHQLLMRHRERIRRMVAVRLDRRLAARVDPSDVVQETLAEAAKKLPAYLRDRPLPFYPWLRSIAWERVVKLHQKHLKAQRRAVTREEPQLPGLPDESALELAQRLIDSGTSPSMNMEKKELGGQVRAALSRLRDQDREILVMRYLEQLSNKEIAAALAISEGALKMRHLRALTSLRAIMVTVIGEDQ